MFTGMRFAWLGAVIPASVLGCGSNDLNPIREGGVVDETDALADVSAASDSGGTTLVESGGGIVDSGAPSHGDAGKTGDGGKSVCKRGIAANTAPTSTLAPTASVPGVSWWYNWSTQGTSGSSAIEFDPMIWGSGALSGPIPSGSRWLLGFNEPHFSGQSNLTPQQAAADWPKVEALAKGTGAAIVSPAVNFCGNASSCSDPTVTDPYTYLKDFFAACPGCTVDAIAVHWYNCDLPSLQGYIDGNSNLQGFVQFGKPIWLTEFCCDGTASVAEQTTYMQAAIPYLENNPHVARYSWFSATPIPNAVLANPDGSLTDLGKTYVALPQNCP